MTGTAPDVSKMSNEQLVTEFRKFSGYAGVSVPPDPLWYDHRPEGWERRLSELDAEILKRLQEHKNV